MCRELIELAFDFCDPHDYYTEDSSLESLVALTQLFTGPSDLFRRPLFRNPDTLNAVEETWQGRPGSLLHLTHHLYLARLRECTLASDVDGLKIDFGLALFVRPLHRLLAFLVLTKLRRNTTPSALLFLAALATLPSPKPVTTSTTHSNSPPSPTFRTSHSWMNFFHITTSLASSSTSLGGYRAAFAHLPTAYPLCVRFLLIFLS